MLLGVVLVGRALEERAKLQASADMAALQVGPRPFQLHVTASDLQPCGSSAQLV